MSGSEVYERVQTELQQLREDINGYIVEAVADARGDLERKIRYLENEVDTLRNDLRNLEREVSRVAYEQPAATLPAWVGQVDDALTAAINALQKAEYVIRGVGGIPSGEVAGARHAVERVRQRHREAFDVS